MSVRSKLKTTGLAVLAGVLLGVSFPPFGLIGGFCAFLFLVPLLIALENTTRLRNAFGIGYIMMFVCSLIATYWVGGWKGEGQVDPFLMVGGIALALVHPIFLILPILTYDAIRRRYGRIAALIALPVVWIGFEYWHSTGDLSFPWLNLYNSQTYNTAYIQFIEFTGSYGLSLVILFVNILLYTLLRYSVITTKPVAVATAVTGMKRWVRMSLIGAILLLIGAPYIYGVITISLRQQQIDKHSYLRVGIIQPNVNPWDKWNTDGPAVTDSMFRASRTSLSTRQGYALPYDLLLWPETAITYPITVPYRKADLGAVYNFVHAINTPILTGIPDREEYLVGTGKPIPSDAQKTNDPMFYYRDWNSAMLFYIAPDGKPNYQRYHKQKLVPFGERVPFVDWFPFLGTWFRWGVGLGSWNVGEGYENFALPLHRGLTAPDTAKFCSMICYESVYPSYVRKFVANGAQFISVITNDGWYGKSSGPYQHNRFAILRAVENRRYIVRSANTGISSIITDNGVVLEQTKLFVSTSIAAAIPLFSEETLYTRLGDFIAIPCEWITGIVVAALFVMWFMGKQRGQ